MIRIGNMLFKDSKILFVLMRHYGCPTTRKIIYEIKQLKPILDTLGVHEVVFIGCGTLEQSNAFFIENREFLSTKEIYQDSSHVIYNKMRCKKKAITHAKSRKAMKIIQKMGYTQGQTATDPQQLGGVWVCQNGKIFYEHREAYKGNCPVYEDILRACGATEDLIDFIRIKDPSGMEHSIKKGNSGKFECKGKGSKTANRIRRRSMITVRSKITVVTGKEKISPRDKKKMCHSNGV